MIPCDVKTVGAIADGYHGLLREPCKPCKGTGSANDNTDFCCPDCGGTGEEPSDNPFKDMAETLARIEAKLDALAKPAAEPGEFMTVREAAEYVKLSRATLYKMKHLQVKRGGVVRFRRSVLDSYFRPRKAAA